MTKQGTVERGVTRVFGREPADRPDFRAGEALFTYSLNKTSLSNAAMELNFWRGC